MAPNLTIKVSALKKSYGKFEALKGIDFKINEGERLALLGSNGAGKTTLIDIISGLKMKTSGEVSVLGARPGSQKVKKELALLPQFLDFPKELKVKEVIRLVSAHHDHGNTNSYIEQLNLSHLLERPIEKLSGGQKRRVSFLITFIGDPKIVVLDEPTASIDMESKALIYNFMENYFSKDSGRTLIFSSHSADEIEKLAGRIILLHLGEVIFDESMEEVHSKLVQKKISFVCEEKNHDFWGDKSPRWKGNVAECYSENSDQFVADLVHSKILFSNLELTRSSLEEIVLNQWKRA